MIHIIKKILLILIIFNIVTTFVLIGIKNRFIVKNPIFGTAINTIINDNNQCKKFNTKSSNIYDYSGKSLIFNIYSIENTNYNDNISLIDNAIKEKLNINVIDIIYYNNNEDSESVKNFITKYNINRPVYYVKRSLLKEKLLIDSNSVIISDFNINNVVKLNSMNYAKLEENIKNLYKKTRKVENRKNVKTTRISNDELLIKSIDALLPIKNSDRDELFFTDHLGKKIFSIHADKNLNYYIGNGKNKEGPVEKVLFNNIKSVKLYKNDLYVLDDIFIKKLDLKTNIISIVLQDSLLKDVVDFDIISDNYFIFSTQTDKIIIYNGGFGMIKSNFGTIDKILKYENKIILLSKTNLKLYVYKNNDIHEFIDINKILNKNVRIKDLTVNGNILYIVTSDDHLFIIKNNDNAEQKSFKNIKNIKTVATSTNYLYISDGSNIYKLGIKDLNNDNYNNKVIKLDFKFYYKSKNYFTIREFDFLNASNSLVWKNDMLSIIINNSTYIDYDAPNYIDLYEVNDNKLSYISKNSVINDSIIFDKIDTNKSYHINGKIYYRYEDRIFVKKINTFVKFKDNYINKNVEINFNNIYLND